MNNFVQEGKVLTLVAPYARNAGEGALVGSTFGVACSDVANADEGEFALEGVFTLPKAATALTQGGLVYWDDSAKAITSTSSGNTKIGVAVEAASSGESEGTVRLNGAF